MQAGRGLIGCKLVFLLTGTGSRRVRASVRSQGFPHQCLLLRPDPGPDQALKTEGPCLNWDPSYS